MMGVQGIALLATAAFLFHVLWLTSRHKLRDRLAFFWLLVAGAGVAIALAIPALDRMAHWLGISYMPTFVLMLAVLGLLTILMYQTIVISQQAEAIKNLAQEIAFLKKEVEDVKRGQGANADGVSGALRSGGGEAQ